MKQTRLASLALVAALALGTCAAKAAIGTTTNYSKLSVSLTITTNSSEIVSGTHWKDPIHSGKAGNKQLLDLFAHWVEADRTTEPWLSAQLVVGWDLPWDYDVLVVDKTGTNVLFDASTGVGGAYFYIDFWDEYGVGADYGIDADPGYYAGTDTGTAYFELYDDNYYLPYTDLYSDGGNSQTWKQNWDVNGKYTTWTDSESSRFLSTGDEYWLDGDSDSTLTGSFSASGHGKGYNEVGWP